MSYNQSPFSDQETYESGIGEYRPAGSEYSVPSTDVPRQQQQFYPDEGAYEYQQGQRPAYRNTEDRGVAVQTGGGGQGQAPYFEYSTCQGRRKALLIGINYTGTESELQGCVNDVHNVQRFICERFGYDPADIVVLTDDARDPRSLPTRENISRAMMWLVDGAQRDDSLFFHYSGHGTQTDTGAVDEADGMSEAICPLDYEEAGLIVDDDLHDILCKPLPTGCRLTAIFDSCHSGSVMDLPYCYSTEGKIKDPDMFRGAQEDLLSAGMAYFRGDSASAMSDVFGIAKNAWGVRRADAYTRRNKTAPADVILWSGCKDDQTSADTQEAGRATGAMSYAFIAALTKNPQQSYQQLLCSIREEMRGRYTQKPQLSACHPIDVDLGFVA